MKTRTLIFMCTLLCIFMICSYANGQQTPTENKALYGTWISPKWDSPPKSNFVQNEGYGMLIFSDELVWFYRKSTDEKDVGMDTYRIMDEFTDQDGNCFYHIVFFEHTDVIGEPSWYYMFKISNFADTLEYIGSAYDQSAIWNDLKRGVYTDWNLYRTSGSNQYDIMYRSK